MSKRVNQAFFMRPWAIKHDVFQVMIEVFHRFNAGEKLSQEEIQLRIGDKQRPSSDYEVIGDTAFVPIYGIIAKRASMVNGISQRQGTSIEAIRRDFQHAMQDSNVKKIVLDVDSPGGSSDGVGELADMIYRSRGKKPIMAYVDGMMASAAYWIGSAADKIYAGPSSEVGSIGVYATVYDWSVANHNQGIKTHVIKAGRNKAAGHPDKPMTEEDLAVIQEEVQDIYEMFVESVARNRDLSAQKALEVATGRTYIARKALQLGLIDGIESLDVEKERAVAQASSQKSAGVQINGKETQAGTKTQEVSEMTIKGLTKEKLKAEAPELHDEIYAEGKAAGIEEGKAAGHTLGKAEGVAEGKASGIAEGKTAGIDEGKKTGAQEERQRVMDILDSAKAIPGSDMLAEAAIKDGTDAQTALQNFKAARLGKIQTGAPQSPGTVDEQAQDDLAHLSLEDRCKKEWETNAQLRQEFASLEAYTGYQRAVSKGRIKRVRATR